MSLTDWKRTWRWACDEFVTTKYFRARRKWLNEMGHSDEIDREVIERNATKTVMIIRPTHIIDTKIKSFIAIVIGAARLATFLTNSWHEWRKSQRSVTCQSQRRGPHVLTCSLQINYNSWVGYVIRVHVDIGRRLRKQCVICHHSSATISAYTLHLRNSNKFRFFFFINLEATVRAIRT